MQARHVGSGNYQPTPSVPAAAGKLAFVAAENFASNNAASADAAAVD